MKSSFIEYFLWLIFDKYKFLLVKLMNTYTVKFFLTQP